MSSLIAAIDQLEELEKMIAMIAHSAPAASGDDAALYGAQIALFRISKEIENICGDLEGIKNDNDLTDEERDEGITADDKAFSRFVQKHHPDLFKKFALAELAENERNEREAINQQFADVISEIDETAKAKKSYSLSEAEIDVLTRAAAANDRHLPKQNQGFRSSPTEKKAAPRRKVAKRR